jgi:hypothetical protein
LSQTVVLNATVTSSRSPVNEGSVVFTVRQGAVAVAQGVGTVSNSTAEDFATIPGGLAPGTYSLLVAYLGPGGTYSDGGDFPNYLVVTPAATTTATASASVAYSTAPQVVNLSAVVQSSYGPVDQGSLRFGILMSNGGSIQSTAFLTGGSAAAALTLPAGLAPGTYALSAVYNPSPTFLTSSDTTQSVTVLAPPPPPPASHTQGFTVSTSFMGTIVQPLGPNRANNGPALVLPFFEFPFPVVTSVLINAAGDYTVHLAGLFFGLFPMSIDVIFSPSGGLLSVAFA